tara:strand:- start:221 stop:634 length:414 start_codon:yes stop_codon:yes gene_type:complete
MGNYSDIDIASAWVRFTHADFESDTYERNFWAFEKLSDYACDEPERALGIIIAILEIDDSETIRGRLAAGPVEDLLGVNGLRVINRIEEFASSNPTFVHVFNGVWNSGIEPEIWARVSSLGKRGGAEKAPNAQDTNK